MQYSKLSDVITANSPFPLNIAYKINIIKIIIIKSHAKLTWSSPAPPPPSCTYLSSSFYFILFSIIASWFGLKSRPAFFESSQPDGADCLSRCWGNPRQKDFFSVVFSSSKLRRDSFLFCVLSPSLLPLSDSFLQLVISEVELPIHHVVADLRPLLPSLHLLQPL